jgi:hypothetical protein
MHDSSAEPAAPGARTDEYATRPCNRHLCVTDCDRARLKADMTDKPRLDERECVDIGGRISIRPIRIPRSVSSEILRVEKLTQGYDFVISKYAMVDHSKFLLHPQGLRKHPRDRADLNNATRWWLQHVAQPGGLTDDTSSSHETSQGKRCRLSALPNQPPQHLH